MTTDRQASKTPQGLLLRSEELFRAAFEQSPMSTQILSPDGRTVWVNRAWEELWGVTLEQLGDYNMLEDQQLVEKGIMPYIEKAFAGERTEIPPVLYDPEETIPNLTHHEEPGRWVRAFTFPVRDESGAIREVVLMHEDITARKRAEEEAQRWANVFEHVQWGVVSVSEDGSKLVMMNPAYARMHGYTVQELIGRPLTDLFAVDAQAELPEQIRLTRERGHHAFESTHIRKDGTVFPVLVETTAVKDYDGQVIYLAAHVQDITARKQIEEELRQGEEKYRGLLENANDIIYTHDLQGNYLTINRACEEITGYTRKEILGGLNIAQVVAPEHLELAKEMTRRKLSDPSQTVYEVDIITKEGRRLTLEISTRIAWRDGQPAAVEGIARDVTERKRAETALKFLSEAGDVIASSLDYETTLASVARMAVPTLADWCTVDVLEDDRTLKRLAVAHVDQGKVEWAYELQKRYPPDMDAPRGIPNVLRTGESEIYPEIADEMLVAAAIDADHLKIMRDIGFTSAIIAPLVTQGRTLGAITFITAESRRIYGQDDLALAESLAHRAVIAIENARLYRSAQEANRLKDEFLATVSHELRTPLTAIMGWAYLLRGGQLEEGSAATALETIERNARSQAQIIDDLLDVSRIITGKLRLDIREVEPVSLIESAIEAVRPAAEAKGVRLQKVIDTGVISIAGDPSRLQQIVWNLLTNAIKFTPKGGRVQIRLERVNSHIEIVVADTGSGIKPDFLPHVFERFRQADQATTRQHGGLGLGLAIVRHLIELHGGTVQAGSAGENQGATFTVRLPVAPIYQKQSSGERVHPAARELLPSFGCPERLDGLKVLIVDDEADTRELLKVGISQCGAEVTTAASASEALEAIVKDRPEILISDIGMPDEDGYELIKKV
ncbi:MAG: PAS domain S-box protein, partial [Acidobacteria bacterium]|nr:PAS domain S-box protein [Acidobacteriota bacterium]